MVVILAIPMSVAQPSLLLYHPAKFGNALTQP